MIVMRAELYAELLRVWDAKDLDDLLLKMGQAMWDAGVKAEGDTDDPEEDNPSELETLI